MAPKGSTGDVQSSTPFTTSDPQHLAASHAAHVSGELVAQQRQDRYLANISGLGSAAGDLARHEEGSFPTMVGKAPAPFTQMPDSPSPLDRSTT